MLFLLTYVIKTTLLFSSKKMLEKYSSLTKVPEMIISFLFLASGVWLFIIIGGIKSAQIIKLVLVFVSIPLAVVGFKKQKKGLALMALILIIGAYGLAEMSKSKPFIPANVVMSSGPNDLFAQGALVYQQNCAFCHGTDGKKMYHNAPDLSQSTFEEDLIAQMIREGSKGKMPAYNLVISDKDIAAAASFVK